MENVTGEQGERGLVHRLTQFILGQKIQMSCTEGIQMIYAFVSETLCGSQAHIGCDGENLPVDTRHGKVFVMDNRWPVPVAH